ncbi:Alpha-1,3-glucosyltransferase [Quillaja saponaria]|uniref:Alpha-1,3-glucosyltransferase n=1 Tax=Quillaja saponaria TaxID=32244 RepID=A0AAD7VCU4_QUISA|nr:Alpha-1,3-glucosyltransferase [Quillaja saponaria]
MKKKVMKEKAHVDDGDDYWCWLVHKGIGAIFFSIAIIALLVGVGVSLHPSGAGNPPKLGDYEAQIGWRSRLIFQLKSGIGTAAAMI